MKLYTEPAFVRAVLADIDAHGPAKAARMHNLTINRLQAWRRARAQLGPEWPTFEMQQEWEAKQARRAHDRAIKARWRKHTITKGLRLIDATGTHRRVQALQRLGWSKADITAASGLAPHTVRELLTRQRVYPETAAGVRRAYDQLSMSIGPSQRAATRAAQKGWAPPLAWDDIDNPLEQPKGRRRREKLSFDPVVVQRILDGDWHLRCNRAEREEVIRIWEARELPLNELDRLVVWNVWRDVKRMREGVA